MKYYALISNCTFRIITFPIFLYKHFPVFIFVFYTVLPCVHIWCDIYMCLSLYETTYSLNISMLGLSEQTNNTPGRTLVLHMTYLCSNPGILIPVRNDSWVQSQKYALSINNHLFPPFFPFMLLSKYNALDLVIF